MRREIQAVVLSGCTIENRFSLCLRNRIENRYSGVLSQAAVLKGSKTLSKLFSLALKLMVLSLSPFFFSCNTCGVGKGNEASFVCVDGIWAGYDRESTKPLVSLSKECNPIPAGRAASYRARPNTNLFGSDVVPCVISAASKGEKQDKIVQKNIGAAIPALRGIDGCLVPQEWNTQPIFSHARNGKEVNKLLSSFRQIAFLLFNRSKVIHRIYKAMRPYLLKKCNY